ncbi:MAG TPA: YihY/virulence factor BrkB family protein [Pseudolabrys sp.]|nr:YihY/virulence factor BrkB family protein [Pseudolabrys sp.]
MGRYEMHRRGSARAPLWPAALTAALLLVGFGRERPQASEADSRRAGRDAENPRTDARGREAAKPSDIPARGWKDVLLRVYASISEDRVMALAAGATYYILLAIFPAIAALVAIYGFFADPGSISNQLSSMQGVLPGGALDVVGDQLKRVASQRSGTLSIAVIVGVLVSLWSANAGVKGLFDALNQVYGEREKRGFIKLNLVTLAFTIGSIGFLIVAMAAVIALPLALNNVELPGFLAQLATIVRWPLLLIAVAIALAFVYRFGPSRTAPQWRWASWGSVAAAVLWIAASILFSWYTANFGSYNKTYGSLGAIVGFMVWIWISMIVVLLGGELNAELEHQTRRDTTTNEGKPMGQRSAYVADTLGSAESE